ncbi:MAG TPA: alpha/beta hydrolase [Flavobacteriales bacterium]|jgi:pimeloyl-ACP methyl ester carboxylesterase|nr:alpha/beta hydrolase [Flavobacteriales bacterium]
MTIYLLPGVGCDERLFDRLSLEGLDVVKLSWPEFRTGGTLTSIAEELKDRVNAEEPHVLIGVSMGGMVAQELALLTHPQKVVLISSWTGPAEWPWLVRVNKALGLQRTIREWSVRMVWPLKRLIDQREQSIDQLLWDMARKQGARQLRRGTDAIMRWPGSRWTGPLVRIHGDKDIVTPLRFPVDHLVKGGQHVMVLTRADEISALLRRELGASDEGHASAGSA